MTMPNFLLIGAPKSGTTALDHYLPQHPQVFMARPKEPGFFAWEGEELKFVTPTGKPDHLNDGGINNIEDYRRIFDSVRDEKAVGEASPVYIARPKAAERIHHYIPDAKLIACLRNPVEAAYSSYMACRLDGIEPLDDFYEALLDQDRRISMNCRRGTYARIGFYYERLMRYFELFEKDQIRIYLYEDFVADAQGMVKDIFRFLDVDDTFVPDMTAHVNVSGVPRNRLLNSALNKKNSTLYSYVRPFVPKDIRRYFKILRNQNLTKPPLSSQAREHLLAVHRDDIRKLEGLISRDLSKWLQ